MKSLILFLIMLSHIVHGQYPLQTGNVWEFSNGNYDTTTAYVREVVGDTIMPNGKKYSIVKEVERPPEQDPRFWGSWFKYHRYDSLKVFEYNPRYNDEYLICDFNTEPSQFPKSTYINDGDTLDFYYNGKSERNLFGKSRIEWSFTVDYNRRYTDDELYFKVTDGIGMTLRSGFLFYYPIKGAVIDGIKYGVLSNIPSKNIIRSNKYSLKQNYPNPFNPKTTINYQLPKNEHVDLSIYNIVGQKVSTLVSTYQPAGTHQIQWDASGFASGVYYYKLEVGDYQEVRKMILMK